MNSSVVITFDVKIRDLINVNRRKKQTLIMKFCNVCFYNPITSCKILI